MTAPSRHRKVRGAETQRVVARYFAANGWPYASDAGAGRPGKDVLGVPGISCEVKARADFAPLAWIRQAVKAGHGDLPMVVLRPNGLGPERVEDWPVVMRFADVVALLREVGFGGDKDA